MKAKSRDLEIFLAYLIGETQISLAKKYKISDRTVRAYVSAEYKKAKKTLADEMVLPFSRQGLDLWPLHKMFLIDYLRKKIKAQAWK